MDLRFAKLLTKNIIAVIGTIIALFAAIAAIGGNVLTGIIVSACQVNQWLWWCVAWHYMLFIFTVVAGVIGFIFFFAIAGDSITALGKWIPKKIQEYRDRPFDVFYKIQKEGNEIYIDVKNGERSIDLLRIRLGTDLLYNGQLITGYLKWKKDFDLGEGFASIERRKNELLHFASFDNAKREFYLHLEGRDLPFPFEYKGIRTFQLQAHGVSSSSPARQFKNNVEGGLVVEQILDKNNEIVFRIGSQW